MCYIMSHVRDKMAVALMRAPYSRIRITQAKLYTNECSNVNNQEQLLSSRDTRMTNHGEYAKRRKSNRFIHNTTCYQLENLSEFFTSTSRRHASTTRKKQNSPTAAPKKKETSTNNKIEVDEEGNEIPCLENGFGYVYYKARLGYEDGLYGVGSFGCSYDRHPEDPKDDYLDFWEIETLIEQRVHCKLVHDYEMADTIEDELKIMHGVYLDNARSIWTTRPELVATKEELLKSREADKDHQVILDLNFTKRRSR